MSMAAKTAGFSAATARLEQTSTAAGPWRPAVDRIHATASIAALSGTALLCFGSPLVGAAFQNWGGALLLLGGALIGVPHGSSDFVVAHRLMGPPMGWRWLPTFLVAYLAVVAAIMAGWALSPLTMLLVFLAMSGLHFGHRDVGAAAPAVWPRLAFAVRATTPVLPIFLLHPAGVSGLLAALGGVPVARMVHLLDALRWPLLLPWGIALLTVTLPPLIGPVRCRTAMRDAAELLAIALAAALLPPLLAFGLYFCLVHAVRHMVDLAEDCHPRRPGAAALLVAGVVLPSAFVCFAVLWSTWNSLAGLLDTDALIAWALRIVAALTVPHMALEWVAAARPRPERRDGLAHPPPACNMPA